MNVRTGDRSIKSRDILGFKENVFYRLKDKGVIEEVDFGGRILKTIQTPEGTGKVRCVYGSEHGYLIVGDKGTSNKDGKIVGGGEVEGGVVGEEGKTWLWDKGGRVWVAGEEEEKGGKVKEKGGKRKGAVGIEDEGGEKRIRVEEEEEEEEDEEEEEETVQERLQR